ncbi:MAG: succinylglutamate desuccinylase/aspartoacylase family protein [Nanoarchaeota archaeon]|nr:succinylglutamate desuccinylase/aspartoacylase family protein [Nanoarchaeota archaeon]
MDKVFGLNFEREKLVYGKFKLADREDGIEEVIPVILYKGKEEGPTLSISANIHGDEVTGILVLHRLLNSYNVLDNMKGNLILLPSLNFYGLKNSIRSFSNTNDDPNRSFPTKREGVQNDSYTQKCMKIFFDELTKHTSYHIDLHSSKLCSVPFVYVEPKIIFNFNDGKEVLNKILGGVKSFGLFWLYDSQENYFSKDYDRTLSSSLVSMKSIPSFTVELGAKKIVDPKGERLGYQGIKNVMVYLGMLNEDFFSLQDTDMFPRKENFEHIVHPVAPEEGLVTFIVRPGDKVRKGDPVAKIRDIAGMDIGNGIITTNYSGFVLAQFEGAFFRKGEPLLKIAREFIL